MKMEVFNCFGHMFRHTHIIWLVVSNINVIFHNRKGMSSFPLTNSIIFQDGFLTTKQMIIPIIIYIYIHTLFLFNTAMENGPFIDGFFCGMKCQDFPPSDGSPRLPIARRCYLRRVTCANRAAFNEVRLVAQRRFRPKMRTLW